MSTEDKGASKGTFKRDFLRENEIAVQAVWEKEGAFEANPDPSKESFLVTFPYPYSNGHLHIGHAFSLTKAVFRAQFERHRGKNVLFPFAFHCTGMPIQAVRQVHCHCFCARSIVTLCKPTCVSLKIPLPPSCFQCRFRLPTS